VIADCLSDPGEEVRLLAAVTFDLWQTLIADSQELIARRDQLRISRLQSFLVQADIPVLTADLLQAHNEVWRRLEELWGANRDLSARDQTLLFISCLKESGNVGSGDGSSTGSWLLEGPTDEFLKGFERSYTDAVLEFPPLPIDGAREVLPALRSRGLKLALICNTGRTPGYCLREILQRYEMAQYFEYTAFSNELLLRKPAEEIFARALKELDVAPTLAIHVGDSLDTDVKGAQNMGMRAVHFDRAGGRCASGVKADFTITTLGQLLPIVEELTG
jgi:putative hydrolase of the HAD superfamily